MFTGVTGIAGVDEAGRGCIAGPVVAAAVILSDSMDESLLGDSKQLTANKRDLAFDQLYASGCQISLGIIDHEEIDKTNILKATMKAMKTAILALPILPDTVLIDGNRVPKDQDLSEINLSAIVKGDTKIPAISAASIIAKVTRDRLMLDYHNQFPHYDFQNNKGYGSESHYEALFTYGPCPIHRRSFNLSKQETLF